MQKPARVRQAVPEIKSWWMDCGAPAAGLALQLLFEVGALSGGLVGSTPERPCDDVCGLDTLPSESDGDAADFLD